VLAGSSVTSRLAAAGFLSAGEEARLLRLASGGDAVRLEALIERRLTGEPLAWITGSIRFCGADIVVRRGVYVPRPQTELIAKAAARLLPHEGVAVDVCTGSGALAKILALRRPLARILATDIDPVAVACAVENGVDALCGDLYEPLPAGLRGAVDVVVAAAPDVPTAELMFLQRDTFTHETTTAYDGGADGAAVLRRVVVGAAPVLRRGGALVMELGGDEPSVIAEQLREAGFGVPRIIIDSDGDVRGIVARRR